MEFQSLDRSIRMNGEWSYYIFLLDRIRSIRNQDTHYTHNIIYDSKRYNFWSYIIFPYLVISVLCAVHVFMVYFYESPINLSLKNFKYPQRFYGP